MKAGAEAVLARCASELRVTAWGGMLEGAKLQFSMSEFKNPPSWCEQAALSFDAMDVLEQSPEHFSAARVLRPWVGEVAP